MALRVTQQKTRQFLLEAGDPLDPNELPEKLQLFDENGQAVNVTQDPTKMHWSGIWDDATPYIKNDVVMDDGKLFIMTADGVAGSTRPIDSEAGEWLLLSMPPPPPPEQFSMLDAWEGEWVAGDYVAGKLVRHNNGLYLATRDADNVAEPGVPFSGAPTVTHPHEPFECVKMGPNERVNMSIPVSGFAAAKYFYFDLLAVGTLTFDKDPPGHMWVSRPPAPSYNDLLFDQATDITVDLVNLGRYFIVMQNKAAGPIDTSLMLTPGTAVLQELPDENPWELVVAGA